MNVIDLALIAKEYRDAEIEHALDWPNPRLECKVVKAATKLDRCIAAVLQPQDNENEIPNCDR